MAKIIAGDIVTVKDHTYGHYKVRKILPKGSHGRRCILVEVIHSTDLNFDFGLIRTYRMIDLRKV